MKILRINWIRLFISHTEKFNLILFFKTELSNHKV